MKDDGGCAFPLDRVFSCQGGMSLRDWFAGKALNGILANSWNDREDLLMDDKVARQSYMYADAMLEERKK